MPWELPQGFAVTWCSGRATVARAKRCNHLGRPREARTCTHVSLRMRFLQEMMEEETGMQRVALPAAGDTDGADRWATTLSLRGTRVPPPPSALIPVPDPICPSSSSLFAAT